MSCVIIAALTLAGLPPDSSAETTVRLSVQPMAAPKPALKYLLLPEVRELHPGNPAQWYIRCFQEQRNFFYSKEAVADRARYRAMPLAKLPVKELLKYGGSALTQADWAARLDTLDWQVLESVQTDGLELTLPELGSLHVLATALQVRFRAEIAGRHFDDAIATAKTMFAMARHLGEYPTEAANRLGLSVADLALDTLTEMVQQPGSPNLYWALTDLPCPLVELRKGFQGSQAQVLAELRPLRDDAPMTEAEVEELVSHLSGGLGYARQRAGLPPRNLRGELRTRVKDPEKVRAARSRLVEAGRAESLVQKLPPAQVILLDEKRGYEVRRDDVVKLLALAPWQIDLRVDGEESGRGEPGLFDDLLPHVLPVRRVQGRMEQRIQLLRHVEAVRLYAAEHDGQLPEKLAEIAVPLPPDPFTGKPFVYHVEATTARLQGAAPRREEKNSAFHVRYEVILQSRDR
jgi:hypothetical protein